MVICYSGRSAPSAEAIADEDDDIFTTRTGKGDINWGRASAHTSLNPDIGNATNKRVMRELFKEHGVPMPELLTHLEQWPMERVEFNNMEWRWPIVGRPDSHTRGRGYWLCNNLSDIQKALRGTRRKQPATHFMEFVEAEREYRVHIFKGKSIRISEKSFFIDDTGHKDYTTTKPQHNIKHVRKAAKKAVKALGLDFGAVDVLATDDECWVLEVNAAPGLGGTMPALYAEVFKKWSNGQWA